MALNNNPNARENARYRKVIRAPSAGARGSGVRTVRIACYNSRHEFDDSIVSFGIGTEDAEAFAKAAVRITEELWEEIDRSMREALRASR